jgi:hypothetical protein
MLVNHLDKRAGLVNSFDLKLAMVKYVLTRTWSITFHLLHYEIKILC